MSQDVQWISPELMVTAAAKLMDFHGLGLLPVCSPDGKAIGVITDRDLTLRVIGQVRVAAETKVGDVMTTPVHFVPPDCPVNRAGELMAELQVSRLLVTDGEGYLCGIVSLVDLIVHASAHQALKTAGALYAREMPDRSVGQPHAAQPPRPEFFHGAVDDAPTMDSQVDHPARSEAAEVNRGGTSGLKEFPS